MNTTTDLTAEFETFAAKGDSDHWSRTRAAERVARIVVLDEKRFTLDETETFSGKSYNVSVDGVLVGSVARYGDSREWRTVIAGSFSGGRNLRTRRNETRREALLELVKVACLVSDGTFDKEAARAKSLAVAEERAAMVKAARQRDAAATFLAAFDGDLAAAMTALAAEAAKA